MADEELLERFRQSQPRGIFLDFDGTLSEIVARPDQAQPLPRARSILEDLAATNDLVAVVSGRPSSDVWALIDASGVEVFGLYGIDEHGPPAVQADDVLTALEQAAAEVQGAWIEDKGASVAVHYRASPDPAAAEARLRPALQVVADRQGLLVLPGKMVLELAPADTPGKGAVILRETRARGLSGCLFAGDDRADMSAFAALDGLRAEGVVTVKVAVRSEETPEDLIGQADIVVERPSGLLELLARI